MSWIELVDFLCAHAGIEPYYFEISGKRHETALPAKILTLEALGLDVTSIGKAEAQLRAREEESWRRWFARFTVVSAQQPAIDVFLPAAEAARVWTWELVLEHGEIFSGEFSPATLPHLGVREIDSERKEHRRLEFGRSLPIGYHRLRIGADETVDGVLACVPPSCYLPPAFNDDRRLWGVSAHVYALNSARNGGAGDFGDLAALGTLAGQAGASAIMLNPFHALFPGRPEEASPYSPSSRLFLNPIYIRADRGADESLSPLRASPLVRYRDVWRAKRAALEALAREPTDAVLAPHAEEFRRFCTECGISLDDFAVFSALEERYGAQWYRMRARYPAPDSPAVAQFAREHADQVALHTHAQILADRQLKDAAEDSRRAGLDVGLMRDLAMGVNPDGFDVWAGAQHYAANLRCGAPPDDFQPLGQEWGVLPLNPLLLRRDPSPFVALLRANMRHAGGLRIDHVIGLQRQFLIPAGSKSSEGCYVRLPMDDLFGLLALESHRSACMAIGEDLGTVPEGFRERMRTAGVFGCAVLYFERESGGAFKQPREYRAKAAASVSTHDLPTLKGYWEGRDCRLRRELGIYSDAEAEAALLERERVRACLIDALIQSGLIPAGTGRTAELTDALRDAVHAYLASSSAQLFVAQLDDLAGEGDQLNVPGTTGAYPNWRRKLSLALGDPALAASLHDLARICAGQGRQRRPL